MYLRLFVAASIYGTVLPTSYRGRKDMIPRFVREATRKTDSGVGVRRAYTKQEYAANKRPVFAQRLEQ